MPQVQWVGCMNYLSWEQTSTLQVWNDAGLDYDSVLSYADRLGLRYGTFFKYLAFNLLSARSVQCTNKTFSCYGVFCDFIQRSKLRGC